MIVSDSLSDWLTDHSDVLSGCSDRRRSWKEHTGGTCLLQNGPRLLHCPARRLVHLKIQTTDHNLCQRRTQEDFTSCPCQALWSLRVCRARILINQTKISTSSVGRSLQRPSDGSACVDKLLCVPHTILERVLRADINFVWLFIKWYILNSIHI